jgi:3',5'-cyclic-AMP phosphodiesterase
MKKPFRIAQLNDLHIADTDEDVYGSPVRKQFSAVINVLKQQPLDAVILLGDLAANAGEYNAYVWIKEQLKEFICPIYIGMGNHDRLDSLNQVFDLYPKTSHHEHYFFKIKINGHPCLFLDTSSYFLPQEQLEWLQQQHEEIQEEILLFMHHPPLYCGCAFMDGKYPLKNISETWSVIKILDRIKHIFCGHYHIEKTVFKDGKTVFLTPSTMVQFDPLPLNITVSHRNPGWRIIEWDGETLRTSVEYSFLFTS